MAQVTELFKRIYGAFGGGGDAVPDISRPEIRRPIISQIRKKVDSLRTVLYRASDYNVDKDENGLFHIPIGDEGVKILTAKGFVSVKEWVERHDNVFRNESWGAL